MFYVAASVLLLAALAAWLAGGPRMAIAVCWGVSLVTPYWLYAYFGPIQCTMSLLAQLVSLGICLTTGVVFRGKWAWADLCVLVLMAGELITEASLGNLKISVMLSGVFQWLLPYLFGRIAFQSLDDLPRLTSVAAWVCIILAGWTATESIARSNPINFLIRHQGSLQAETDLRWGFRRAEGPANHPIGHGNMMVMLLPWAVLAYRRAREGTAPQWHMIAPVAVCVGVFFTMSRGPQLAALGTLYGVAVFRFPEWRSKLVFGGLAVLVVGGIGYQTVLAAVKDYSNETDREKLIISIKGEPYEYSGTNHRFLQLLVYEDAAIEAGWFGWGIDALINNIDTLPLESSLTSVFRSVDNQYLVQVLRSGYFGLLAYLAMIVAGCYQVFRAGVDLRSPYSMLAAAIFCSLVAVDLNLVTVWLSPDVGSLLMFMLGVSSSLSAAYAEQPWSLSTRNEIRRELPHRRVTPRLAPGHPMTPAAAAV